MRSFPDLTSGSPAGFTPFFRRRWVRPGRRKAIVEGISLWLAVLLFLAIQPLYAKAGETAAGSGELRYLSDRAQRPVTAALLQTDYQITGIALMPQRRRVLE